MLTLFASVTIEEAHLEEFLAEFTKVAAATRQENGNHRYEIYQSVDDPTQIHFHEEFTDEAALAAHSQSTHFTQFFEKVKPWIVRGPEAVRAKKLQI